ncbi:MAG: tetratricopeptide repeat protein [Rhodospirillaceae bacterium]|nr:tetratricopeptide repeat protein [Rhodospirillaceae bacterium]
MKALLLGAALLVAVSAARADQVVVNGEMSGTSARVAFEWPTPVRYTAQRIDRRLIITFARPFEGDLSGLAAKLPGVVKSARVASDGRTVVIELEKTVLLRTEVKDRSLIFELADTSSPPSEPAPRQAAAPPAAAPPAAAPPGAAPPAQPRTPPAQAQPPQTPAPAAQAPQAQPPQAPPAPAQPAPPPAAGAPARTPPAQTAAAPSAPVAATPPQPAQAPAAAPPPTAQPPTAQPPAGQPSAGQPPAAPAARAPSALPPAASAPASPAPAAQPPASPAANTAARPPAAAAPATGSTQTAAPAPEAAKPAADGTPTAAPTTPVVPQAVSGTPVLVKHEPRGDATAVRFEWPAPAGTAVFRRAGYLWVVFDQPGAVDFSPILAANAQVVAGFEQLPSSAGTAIRMAILPGVNPHVERDGLAWVLELRAAELRPDIGLIPEVQKTGQQGLRMFIAIADPADPIRVRDPEVGDELTVVPVAQLGRGVDGERQYADFNLLSTAQGIAAKVITDELQIRSIPDGVTFVSPDGLNFTHPDVLAQIAAESAPNAFGALPPGRVFDMVGWRRGNLNDFQNQKQLLQRRVAEATRVTRSQPRLDLASFYFAHGLAAEAMGLLRTIEVEDPDLAGRPDVLALRGATRFALTRFDEAGLALFDNSLNGKSEIELWRGATYAALGDYRAAIQSFSRAGTIPPGYPPNFVADIALNGAEAALRNRDFRSAGAYLDAVNDTRPGPAEQARVDYYRGRIFAAAGDSESAVELWTRLTRGEDRWSRIRSELALLDDALARKATTRAEAIQKLESLRFVWRGDRLELDMLTRLGQLYIEEGDIRNGLTVLKQTVSAFPDTAATRDITRQMTEAFSNLYLQGGANALPPLAALALYEDFRELTPPGAQGNEIINRLADRLVAVELLERAANLLDRQVKSRLEGTDKARVGARLALIRLLDRKPDAAIKALDNSAVQALPADVAAERTRLRSRALFELERPDEALRLISNDMTRDADLLRAEITWKTARWREASDVFGRLVGDGDAAAVDERRGQLVLNLAVSLALAGDSTRLGQVRQRFAPAMDRTQFREAFRLITNPSEGALNDYSKLSARFQEIDRFQAFMTSYRDKLKTTLLSAIN